VSYSSNSPNLKAPTPALHVGPTHQWGHTLSSIQASPPSHTISPLQSLFRSSATTQRRRCGGTSTSGHAGRWRRRGRSTSGRAQRQQRREKVSAAVRSAQQRRRLLKLPNPTPPPSSDGLRCSRRGRAPTGALLRTSAQSVRAWPEHARAAARCNEEGSSGRRRTWPYGGGSGRTWIDDGGFAHALVCPLCWGFKNQMESPNINKKKLKNIRKKKSENAETRNLRKPDFLLQSCEPLYTCPRTPFYRDTKGLLHSEITLESREYF
jgi:hypothetical protein